MTVKLGNLEISKLYLGATEVSKAYLGAIEVFSSAEPNGLLNGLVSYYKCDTNSSFPDAHGSNNGTINGATYTASGILNGAYDYDGINDYIALGSNIVLNSISVWVKSDVEITTTANTSGLASQGTDPYGIRFGVVTVQATNEIITIVGGGSSNVSYWDSGDVPSITTDWHHIVIVYEGGTNYRLYYDGVDKGLSINGVGGGSGQINLSRIGMYRNDNGVNGLIDEIGFWNNQLTSTEVTALYNSGDGLSYDNFTS